MFGFKTLDELSLKECAVIIAHNEGDALIEEVRAHYEDLLKKTGKQEDADFKVCKTIKDYDGFIAKYKVIEGYSAKHLEDAAQARNLLVRTAQQEEAERQRRERQRAVERAERKKRILIFVLLSIVVAAVSVFFVGYRPAKSLLVSDISFGKEGGTKTLRIETNVSPQAISVDEPNAKWVSFDRSGDMISVTAGPNPDPERSCAMVVEAYSTFFGTFVGTPKRCEVIIRQGSGYASCLDVSAKSISVGKYGETKQVNIKTDGVKLELSSNDWIRIKPKSQNHDGQYFHNDNYEIEIGVNPTGDRTGKIFVETGGLKKEIAVSQTSGLAKYFRTNKTSFGTISKWGSTETLTVDTDGTTWKASTGNNWIGLVQTGNTLKVKVDSNSGDVRTGYVTLSSNNGHGQTITIDQDGNPSSFYAYNSSMTFDTERDQKDVSFNNNSLQSVYTSDNQSWLSTSITGNKVRVYCEPNSGEPRDGKVTLTCGDKETVISIHQKGWKKCTSCNNGHQACPNNFKSWVNEFGTYYYTYENGRHILVRGYTSWEWYYGSQIPVPRVDKSICSACGGDGWVTCSKCKGKGKIKTDY